MEELKELKKELLKHQEVLSVQNRYILRQIDAVDAQIRDEKRKTIPKELEKEMEEIDKKVEKELIQYNLLQQSIESIRKDAHVISLKIGKLNGQRDEIRQKINRFLFS